MFLGGTACTAKPSSDAHGLRARLALKTANTLQPMIDGR